MNAILNTLANENTERRLAWVASRIDVGLIAAAVMVLAAACLR